MDRPPRHRLTAGEVRDGIQVGGFFGALAGIAAAAIALLVLLIGSWFGHPVAWRDAILSQLTVLPLYLGAGALITMFWHHRTSRPGHFGLRCVAALPVALSVAAATAGPPWGWPGLTWLKVVPMIPAFAWVFGGRSRRGAPAAQSPS